MLVVPQYRDAVRSVGRLFLTPDPFKAVEAARRVCSAAFVRGVFIYELEVGAECTLDGSEYSPEAPMTGPMVYAAWNGNGWRERMADRFVQLLRAEKEPPQLDLRLIPDPV